MFHQFLYHPTLAPSALLFPAVDPKRRYLIHSTVQDYFPTLTSLSVGQGDQRRTAVTFRSPSPPTNSSHPSSPDSPPPPSSSDTSKNFPIASQTFENSKSPSVHNSKHSTSTVVHSNKTAAHSTPQQRSTAPYQPPSTPHSERGKAEEKRRGSSDQRRHVGQAHVVEARGLQHEEATQQERQHSTQRQHEGQPENGEQHSTQRRQSEQHNTQRLHGELHNSQRQQQGSRQQQKEGQHSAQRQRSEQHNTQQGQQHREQQHRTYHQHNTSSKHQEVGAEQQHNNTQHSQRVGQHSTQRQHHNAHSQQGGEQQQQQQQCNIQRQQLNSHRRQAGEQQHHTSSKHKQQVDKNKRQDRTGTGEWNHHKQTNEGEQQQQLTRSRSSSSSSQSLPQPQDTRVWGQREAENRERHHQGREITTAENGRNYTNNNKISRQNTQEEAGKEEQQARENTTTASEHGNNSNKRNRRNRKNRRNTKDWNELPQGGEEDGNRPSEPDPGGGAVPGNQSVTCVVRGVSEDCGTNSGRGTCTVGRTNGDGTRSAGGTSRAGGINSTGGTKSGVKNNNNNNRSIGGTRGGTCSEGGRRKKLKSTGEEEEETIDLRGATPDVDSRLCSGRLGSPIEESWVSDSQCNNSSNNKDSQRMPVTMPPENCTANNKRRGKAAAQIYRPPPARNSREEVTPLLPHQSQKHVSVHDPHKNTLQQDAHRNSYLQDLQRNGYLQQDVHRNNYLQDLQRNGYNQDGVRSNEAQRYSYHPDLQRNSYHQDPQRYCYQDTQVHSYPPENQSSGRHRTESESSMAGDLKTGRGRRPDQVLYIPRGRRGHSNLQDPSSARATPTPLQEYVDMARPPSPAMSVCSVASEFSGRNRYNRSQQGSQASVYDGDMDRVKGKPPVSKCENGQDGTQGNGKQKNNGRFAVQTLQLLERCLNQDSDQRHGEKWETESLNYSPSPNSKQGGHSSGERVQKSPTPTRDIHSIHSKENIINPVESGKRPRKRRTRRRHSRSREPSADKHIDSVTATSCVSNRDQQYSNGRGDGEFGSSEKIFYNSSYERYDRGYDNYDRYSSINNSRASSRNSSRERAPPVQSQNYSWRSGPNNSSPAKGSVINSYSRGSPGKPPTGRLGSLPNVSLDYGDSPRKNSLEERFHTLPAQHDHRGGSWKKNINNVSIEDYKYEGSGLDRFSHRTSNGKDQNNSEDIDQSVLEPVNGDRSDGDSEEKTKNHVIIKDSEELNSVSSRVGDTSMDEESVSQQNIDRSGMEESVISNQSAAESLEEVESNVESSIMDSVHSESWSENSNHRTNGTIAEEESVCELEASIPDTEYSGTDSIPIDATQITEENTSLAENSTKALESEKEEQDYGNGRKKGSKKFAFNWADQVDDSWDSLYNDAGECLDSDVKQQLSDSFGKIKLEKPTNDYYNYQPKEPEMIEEEYAHVIEIYDFPTSFKTQDLMMVFKEFQNNGFDIKWVDDTHALGIFSTALVAADALSINHPFIKTRSLASATKSSRSKAMRITDALLPYKPRPATSATLARRLVSGALGLRVNISREVREAEKQKLKDAKARKRLVAKQRLDAWEGTLT
ncbi:hypothetical protein Pcinc_017748 [Petrolisthes cinctipes]|uniref:Coiled-coil domain-containing protein R3HCC1L n=1 Tax=Petrolisthes cinctipes TaxID=88211 RepID=A0AAE1KPK0_PETCI|nr:hypothetical protein Pcinc_017748 [Petrolisthes cinctipes]